MFFLLYRHTDDGVFDNFPKISDHFPKISKLISKVTQTLPNISQNFPKIAEDFRGRPENVSIIPHCYCASLVRTLFIRLLFIGQARATSFSSARTDSKTQQNIERMTFALT